MALATKSKGHISPNKGKQLVEIIDTALNDSDKTLTVPAGVSWEVKTLFCELITTATVGNRRIRLELTDDSGNVAGQWLASADQTASLTETYNFVPTGDSSTEPVTGVHIIGISPIHAPSGYGLRIYDEPAIAAAADDLTIRGVVVEHR